MSDSSEEDLSKFREAVDNSFTNEINGSTNQKYEKKVKSDRNLEIASHYNDVRVSKELQKNIGAKVSALIARNIEYININNSTVKQSKIKGGVKLFKNSESYLTCDEARDVYTEQHNKKSKKLKNKLRQIDGNQDLISEKDKIKKAAIDGEYVLSKEETKCWKSRRKEKLYKYKKLGNSNVLTSIE